ncbi:zinc-binding dehydrogenase [Arthrobacter sp. H41]|uniref:zinc-binding dehydrogenase n=1 Tax=Arthrobacter sp. H41 TaxID=1312978 RepID=UPI0020A6BDC5|nr:zinc-binding dehydrogenase [Arthrobacter sp. H41]
MAWADFNLLKLPDGTEKEANFTILPDILPTGYHGAELAMVAPGKTVAVFGAGPVGLMAAHIALLKGAARVFVMDKEPDRLKLTEQIGATAINFADTPAADAILETTGGFGVDCGIEAVGYQAHDHTDEEHPEMVLDNLVSVVRATGHIGVVGVYVPEDPKASTDLAKEGRIAFNYGQAFTKGISIAGSQCPVKKYNRELRDLIIAGRSTPSWFVSHEVSLDEAVDAYARFDKREDGYTKVLLHP